MRGSEHPGAAGAGWVMMFLVSLMGLQPEPRRSLRGVLLLFFCCVSACLVFFGSLPTAFTNLSSVFDGLPNVFRRCGGLAPLAGAWQELLCEKARRLILDVGLIN